MNIPEHIKEHTVIGIPISKKQLRSTITKYAPVGGGTAAAAGVSDFVSLTDTPANYVGAGGDFVKVNAAANALEFVAAAVAGHDILSASHTDAAVDAVTRGSLIYGNSTPAWDELVIGAANTFLYTDGTDAAWTNTMTGNLNMTAHIIPTADSTYDLGSSTPLAWANLYVDNIKHDDLRITADTADGTDNSLIRLGGGGATGNTRGATIQLMGNESAWTGKIQMLTGNIGGAQYEFYMGASVLIYVMDGNAFYPNADSSRDLGSSTKYWAETYTDKLYLNATATLDGTVAGTITGTGNMTLTGSATMGGAADVIQLKVIGNAGQSANIFEIEDSGNNDLFTIDSAGNGYFSTTLALQFRDNAVFINSATDGHLDLDADVSIDLNTPAIVTTGTLGCGTITLTANSDLVASGTGHVTSGSEGFIVGTLTITDGSIDDTDGSIAFGATNFTGVGTISCGAITSSGDGIFGGATGLGTLDVMQPNLTFPLIIGADVSAQSRTDNTRKFTRFGMPHYHNAEEPAILMMGDSNGTDNKVSVGGGTSAGNAATEVTIYTAANDATTTGSARMNISSAGATTFYGNVTASGDITASGAASDVNVGGVYKVDGTQVVTNRQAFINDASGTLVDATATINQILDLLIAHGLMSAA